MKMKKKLALAKFHVIAAMSVFILLTGNSVLADNEQTHDQARRLKLEGKIVSLEKIIAKAKTLHSGKILEAELEEKQGHYIYEIELLDNNGSVWELKYDAASATLLSTEKEH